MTQMFQHRHSDSEDTAHRKAHLSTQRLIEAARYAATASATLTIGQFALSELLLSPSELDALFAKLDELNQEAERRLTTLQRIIASSEASLSTPHQEEPNNG